MKPKLVFGEAKMIADECGTSVVTLNKALRGEINTPIAIIVRNHTKLVIKQREERIKIVKEQLSNIKKEIYARH